jgi:putative flippase GtrA
MWIRWLKFNFVGVVGVGVQLAMLEVLTRLAHMEYMIATALAVETTVLHNFLWHERYTWLDRRHHSHFWRLLLHFNLSNGAISILGNVVLMRLFVGWLHMPVIAANIVAITICGLANFLVSDRVVFRHRPAAPQSSVAPPRERSVQ